MLIFVSHPPIDIVLAVAVVIIAAVVAVVLVFAAGCSRSGHGWCESGGRYVRGRFACFVRLVPVAVVERLLDV